jgi:hypothetical protein
MDKWRKSDFDVEPLAAVFHKRLKDKNFESIYKNSFSGLQCAIPEEDFVSKLKNIYNFMIKADSGLNWRPNPLFAIPSGGLGVIEDCYYAQKIFGPEREGVMLGLYWLKVPADKPKLKSIVALILNDSVPWKIWIS